MDVCRRYVSWQICFILPKGERKPVVNDEKRDIQKAAIIGGSVSPGGRFVLFLYLCMQNNPR